MIQKNGSRILVADDNLEIVKLLKEILNRDGYEVISACDGEEALGKVKESMLDLVLLDVGIPKINGYEVCKIIKEDKNLRFIPVVIITALSAVEDKIKGIEAGADDFLNKPVNMSELLAKVKSLIRLKYLNDHLENTESILFVLAQAVEAKDAYTDEHLKRMARYSSGLGRHIGLPYEMVVALEYAGILHDIGKIGISESILCKPGKLTEEEFERIKEHSVIGEKIVRPLRFSNLVAPIVRGHHERWDGRGYPDGLAGEKIPIGARIVSIADAYDAMTTDRPYRRGMSKEKVVSILREGKGSQWDTKLVEAFINFLDNKI